MHRKIKQIVQGLPTSDGAGVELVRVIGQPAMMELDPFLLLDAFRSDDPEDYIAGFPAHPHRGFETVTYLLNGKMRHKDNTGREGVIEPGGIQWMTAARGIIHSEMPEQENGLLEGFQLWVNLPAKHKMDPPGYQEHDASKIPLEQRAGAELRVIAGTTSQGTRGPVVQPLTDPLYLDVQLGADATFEEPIDANHNAFVYGVEGQILIAGEKQQIGKDQLAVLDAGDRVELQAAGEGARFLLVSGEPLGEPIVRGGPFVMNSRAEINQAIVDYQSGKF